jgi:diguanylate cyclase (GGDEF)-like protein/PAS domain S-box-containing protein
MARDRGTVAVSPLEEHSLSWQNLLEALPDGTALIDVLGVMRYVNAELAHLTGYCREELVGQNVQILVPPRLRTMEGEARREYIRDPERRLIWNDRNLTVLRKDGSELPVDFALSPINLDGRQWTVGSIRDNSAQRVAEQARVEAEQHFRLAFEDNMAPMVFTDLNDCIIAANDAFCTMMGRTRRELIGFDSKPFTHPDDVGITEASHKRFLHDEIRQVKYVKRYLHSDGRLIVAEVSKSPARDEAGNTLYFIISERDITEERKLTAQLSHQALHDPLTGLANRALFDDRLSQAHSRVMRHGGHGALLLLDLDDFKGVNDTYGHLVGDQLLADVARRMELVSRSTDTLCRFGGDEFLYLAEGISGPEEAELIAQRFLRTLDEPFLISGLNLEQRASLGVVVWDSNSTDVSEVVRDADVALYEAKRLGKGRHFVYVPGMHHQVVNRFSLVQQLRQAIPAGDMAMHYQPIVRLSTGAVVGFEALMRWRHDERGWVPPSVFIPLAEQSNLILELGSFALNEAIRAASAWRMYATEQDQPYVTVNLSARQFHDPGLLDVIKGALDAGELPADRLIIEITEGVALIEVNDTLEMLEQLTKLGIGVALDDFGTGFSSLSYLALLNPMIIKVDQSFVRPAVESIHSDRLLETIVTLGHNLGMTMLAEGIETKAQLERLRELHCSLGQGFLFSPAVPFDDASAMVGTSFSQ